MCDEEGVDPSRIVLGHSGDSTDADHLTELAEAGFVLGMDRFGINLGIRPCEARADIVVELCRRGFAEQLVLSHDASCYIDWIDPNAMALLPQWHYLPPAAGRAARTCASTGSATSSSTPCSSPTRGVTSRADRLLVERRHAGS